jgi:hypothetical protein
MGRFFDWFKPSHCNRCAKSQKNYDAYYWGLIFDGWDDDRIVELYELAELMVDDEEEDE